MGRQGKVWWYLEGERRFGSYTPAELVARFKQGMAPGQLVAQFGWKEWKPAEIVPEFAEIFLDSSKDWLIAKTQEAGFLLRDAKLWISTKSGLRQEDASRISKVEFHAATRRDKGQLLMLFNKLQGGLWRALLNESVWNIQPAENDAVRTLAAGIARRIEKANEPPERILCSLRTNPRVTSNVFLPNLKRGTREVHLLEDRLWSAPPVVVTDEFVFATVGGEMPLKSIGSIALIPQKSLSTEGWITIFPVNREGGPLVQLAGDLYNRVELHFTQEELPAAEVFVQRLGELVEKLKASK